MHEAPAKSPVSSTGPEITVYRWVKSGELPCIRPGGRIIRVSESDFRNFKAARSAA